MPYRDKKMYKPPRLPKAGELQGSRGGDAAVQTRDVKPPTAPMRESAGMMRMAAASRAKQGREPKPGSPPIPTAMPRAVAPMGGEMGPRQAAAVGMMGRADYAPRDTAYAPKYAEGGDKPDDEQEPTPFGMPVPAGAGPDGAPTAPGQAGEFVPEPTPGTGQAADPGAVPTLGMVEEAKEKQKALEEEGIANIFGKFGEKLKKGAAAKERADEEAYAALSPEEQQAQMQKDLNKKFSDYLAQQTGIPPEELEGQMEQLKAAGYNEMAKLAQQMAARGMGTSGLVGAGMGQIQTQVMLGIANLKFENAKLGVEERINKMKNFMAFYGHQMSEANKRKHLDFMEQLEAEKFQYEKDQNVISNNWIEVNNFAAALQAEGGWDTDALEWAMWATSQGMTAQEVITNMYVSGTGSNKKIYVSNPNKGKGEGGAAEEGEVDPSDPDHYSAQPDAAWAKVSEISGTWAMTELQNNPGYRDEWAKGQGYKSWQDFLNSLGA